MSLPAAAVDDGKGAGATGACPGVGLTTAHFIPTLDGWRAIAIGAVIVCHIAAFYTQNSLFIHLGAQGVALFFAISGFLITTRLLIEHEITGTISLRSFYIRRAFRILPPAFSYLLTLYVLSLFGIVLLRRGELISALLFFSNYWPDRSWFTAHFWSLSIEEHFYLFWPLVVLLGGKRARWFAVAAIIATIIWRPFGERVLLFVEPFQRTDMRLDAFMFACLLAILMRDRRFGSALKRMLTRPELRLSVLISIVAAYALTLKYPGLRLVKELAQSAFIPLLIGGTVAHPADWIGQRLDGATLRLVGRLSYGLYLWQELFLTNVVPVPLASRLALLLCVTAISYYGFEKRCMDFGHRLSKRGGE